MQPVRRLARVPQQLSAERSLLLTPSDLRGVVPEISDGALRVMLTRAAASGVIERVCRGLYWHGRPEQDDGLIVRAEGREEILADKIIAFALRPNRLKHRDLWDIGWLRQQNVQLPMRLIPAKTGDHGRSVQAFRPLRDAMRS